MTVRPSVIVRARAGDIAALAAGRGVSNIRVFGSVARGADRPGSDLDLIVHFPPGADIVDLLNLEADLSTLLGVPVDVIPDDGDSPVTKSALAEAVPLSEFVWRLSEFVWRPCWREADNRETTTRLSEEAPPHA
ncbi:MAG: nucleotidyltransferase family protein [Propionibacteriaceae bacterium]|nr:nucleotidyltransferase family protein [Propionibacteriaceae bacterium]